MMKFYKFQVRLMKYSLVFFLLISSTSYGQVLKNLVGFQNIPWGSSIDVVKSKVQDSRVVDECKDFDDEFKASLRKRNVNCRVVIVDKYVINNIELNLKASFNNQAKLERVTLSKTFSTNDFMKDCGEAFKELNFLLELRYGASEIPNLVGEGIFPYNKFDVRAWLPLPTEIWIAKAYDIDNFYKKRGMDSCQVKINYSKRQSDASSKL